MELKPYQQEVLSDLEHFLVHVQAVKDPSAAFHNFWTQHPRTPLQPFPQTAIEPYKNTVPGVPHVCVKVPTAGGKTFIACNALKTIFDAFDSSRRKAVVWLVPSITILEQTLRHLKDNRHPYRQKINMHFANRVGIYDKQALLQGSGFNAASVSEQLSIFVLSFDSLRARNKEDRKVYQENSNLQSFGSLLGRDEDISVMRVIRSLNPVVVVDESHNAESELSVEMLKSLEPCFIFDLTATPRKNSNIISFVDAMALKEHHMVKLPVIVYNHQDRAEMIRSSLQLQRKLEKMAIEEERDGGRYIRPIVLFQAQPKNAGDTITFEKVKELLIQLNIPEEQIRLKTAEINEIRDVDLTARDCPVRYIITVNALKEGWDCPFAYILTSLADKSSAVDVEQVLGRILRQPYVMPHEKELLNMSYVLTASSRFLETLDNIVKGLNRAGFSSRDFKAAEAQMEAMAAPIEHEPSEQPSIPLDEPFEDDNAYEMEMVRIMGDSESDGDTPAIAEIEQRAREQMTDLEHKIGRLHASGQPVMPAEIQNMIHCYKIKDGLSELAAGMALPQFFIRKPSGEIFSQAEQLLSKEDLLDDFHLSRCDSNISFNGISSELYRIDLDTASREHTPTFVKIDGRDKNLLMSYLLQLPDKESRAKNFAARINHLLGNMYPIAEQEIKKYLYNVLQDFTPEQYSDFADHEYSYVARIREKIDRLAAEHAEKTFAAQLSTDHIFMKHVYQFPVQIIPGSVSKPIAGSLYEREADMNGFEEKVISEVAALPGIAFWTRNMERKQFKINGFINHYPDFIIHTKKGKTILLETKGDDRDNSDSRAKLELGKAWEKTAGNGFRYFMVFDRQEMPGAHRLDEFLKLLREL